MVRANTEESKGSAQGKRWQDVVESTLYYANLFGTATGIQTGITANMEGLPRKMCRRASSLSPSGDRSCERGS
jgi:hypothetical protein